MDFEQLTFYECLVKLVHLFVRSGLASNVIFYICLVRKN